MAKRSPREIAKILAGFYGTKFYGKINSKYRIKKEDIKSLAGINVLKSGAITEIKKEMKKLGYTWADIGKELVVLEAGPFNRVRAVRKDMIDKLTGLSKKKTSPKAPKSKKKISSKTSKVKKG